MKIDSSTQLSQNRKLPDHQFVLIEPHLIIIVQVGILCKSIYPTDILLPHLVPSSCAWVTYYIAFCKTLCLCQTLQKCNPSLTDLRKGICHVYPIIERNQFKCAFWEHFNNKTNHLIAKVVTKFWSNQKRPNFNISITAQALERCLQTPWLGSKCDHFSLWFLPISKGREPARDFPQQLRVEKN